MPAIRTFRRLLTALAGLTALAPVAARAQAIDYGTLEEMYGEPVTTSATGKPQLASVVPADMVIISQDDIRRSGADNIPDILQFITGLEVRRYGFADADVGIRGYDTGENPRLLVLVDGRQVYLDYYGYTAWNAIPVQLDEIRQIEIVKGPASALFGFNAASGVINIITFDPLLDEVNTATVRGGTQGYGGGDAVATQHIGSTAGVRISVGGWTASGFEDRQGTLDPIAPRYGSVNISARWQISSNILLRAEGGMTDAHSLTQTPVGDAQQDQNQLNFWRIGAAADTKVGTLDLDIYRNQALNNAGDGGPFNNTNETLVAKLTDLLKLNANNTIRVGLEYRRNGIQYSALNGGTDAYDNYAVNGMWDWQITPAFELTNAARLDHLVLHNTGAFVPTPGRTDAAYNNETITQPSFNSGLVIRVSDLDTIRITAARGLQVPSLFQYTLQTFFNIFAFVGSPDLHPTSVWNAELAYDRKLPALDAILTTSVFFQRNTNLLATAGYAAPTFQGPGLPLLFNAANLGSSNEIGFEIGLRGTTKGGLRWNASYRYASITDDIIAAAAAFPGVATRYAGATPTHAVILGVGYTLQKWEFDAQGRWQSSYTDYLLGPNGQPGIVPISDYVTFNARIGYRATNYLTLAGTAQQFNVSRLLETAGDYVDRRFIASANVRF